MQVVKGLYFPRFAANCPRLIDEVRVAKVKMVDCEMMESWIVRQMSANRNFLMEISKVNAVFQRERPCVEHESVNAAEAWRLHHDVARKLQPFWATEPTIQPQFSCSLLCICPPMSTWDCPSLKPVTVINCSALKSQLSFVATERLRKEELLRPHAPIADLLHACTRQPAWR